MATDYLSQLLSQDQPQKKKKRAFISFDFDNDEQLRNVLNAQSKNEDSPFYFEDWSVKDPFPQSTWESDVKTKIKQCDFVVVIIGKSTHRCSGVLEEVRMANEERLPSFGIYDQNSISRRLDGSTYVYVPEGLGTRHFMWTWPNLTSAINNLTNYYPQV